MIYLKCHGQGNSQSIWRKCIIVAVLKLFENEIQGTKDTRLAHAEVTSKFTETSSEHIQMP